MNFLVFGFCKIFEFWKKKKYFIVRKFEIGPCPTGPGVWSIKPRWQILGGTNILVFEANLDQFGIR